MAGDLVERARQAVYDAGVIIDLPRGADEPTLEQLAGACDMLEVPRPVVLQEALAAEDRG